MPSPFRHGRCYSRLPRREWTDLLARYGGRTPTDALRYRLVWGFAELPQYWYEPRWLEKWHLEWATPDLDPWRLGLRPGNHGAFYARVFTFETPSGDGFRYVEPTHTLLREAVGAHRLTLARSDLEIRSRIQQEEEEKRKADDAHATDLVKSHYTAFPGSSWLPVGGPMTAKHRRLDTYRPQ